MGQTASLPKFRLGFSSPTRCLYPPSLPGGAADPLHSCGGSARHTRHGLPLHLLQRDYRCAALSARGTMAMPRGIAMMHDARRTGRGGPCSQSAARLPPPPPAQPAHPPTPAVHVEGVEFDNCGQDAIGRYPGHFHLAGQVPPGTYVRAAAVHDSNFRAVTLHGTQGVLVERAVAVNVLGHAYFFEDGAEFGNTLRNNLGMLGEAQRASGPGRTHAADLCAWSAAAGKSQQPGAKGPFRSVPVVSPLYPLDSLTPPSALNL